MHDGTVVHWRDQFTDISRGGKRVAFGHIENETVGQDTAAVKQRECPVSKGVAVELERDDAVCGKAQRVGNETDGIFEIPALHLEMVRTQMHTFRPNDFSELFHETGDDARRTV